VRLQPLLVRRACGHRDVRVERDLELLLLAVSLVEVLHEFGVALVEFSHRLPASRKGLERLKYRNTRLFGDYA
jgi:hypothetical protein